MLQRIRFTDTGIEIENQEGNKIVEKFTISWNVLKQVMTPDVLEYLRLMRNPFDLRAPMPTGIFEFYKEDV